MKTLSDGFAVECWNPSGRINDQRVQDEILATEPDIAVFPEAVGENIGIQPGTAARFKEAGYELHCVSYDDEENEDGNGRDPHILAMIVKPEHVADVRRLQLGGCPAMLARLQGGVELMAFQLNSLSGQWRLLQAKGAVRRLGETAVAVGATYALHGDTLQSRLLRRAAGVTRRLPSVEPGIENPSRLRRLGSRLQQMTGFADGVTMRVFGDAGFTDVNENHVPTMGSGLLATDTDRILRRGHVQVVEPTRIDTADGLSDCRRIRAELAHRVWY